MVTAAAENSTVKIDEDIHNEIVTITPRGQLTDDNARQLTARVRELLEEGQKRLLFDLGDVTLLDTAGVGAIAQAYISSVRRGGAVKLLHVIERHHRLLVITKLLTIIETYDSQAEAERSFESAH